MPYFFDDIPDFDESAFSMIITFGASLAISPFKSDVIGEIKMEDLPLSGMLWN